MKKQNKTKTRKTMNILIIVALVFMVVAAIMFVIFLTSINKADTTSLVIYFLAFLVCGAVAAAIGKVVTNLRKADIFLRVNKRMTDKMFGNTDTTIGDNAPPIEERQIDKDAPVIEIEEENNNKDQEIF